MKFLRLLHDYDKPVFEISSNCLSSDGLLLANCYMYLHCIVSHFAEDIEAISQSRYTSSNFALLIHYLGPPLVINAPYYATRVFHFIVRNPLFFFFWYYWRKQILNLIACYPINQHHSISE